MIIVDLNGDLPLCPDSGAALSKDDICRPIVSQLRNKSCNILSAPSNACDVSRRERSTWWMCCGPQHIQRFIAHC